MVRGIVKWFDSRKGYGFIAQDSGQEVFVHHSAILASGYKKLREGEKVVFEVIEGDKGLRALNVHPVLR